MDHNLEEIIRCSEALNLVESAIAILDPQGHLVFKNAAFALFNASTRDAVENFYTVATLLECPSMQQLLCESQQKRHEVLTPQIVFYGLRIKVAINLRIRPIVKDNSGEIIGSTITLGEESIAFDNHHLARAQESSQALVARVRELSEIKFSNDRLLRMLFKKAPFAIVLMNEQRQVLQLNRAGEQLFGVDERTLLGKSCDTFLQCFHICQRCPLQHDKTKIELDEISGFAADGRPISLLRSAVIFEDQNSKLIVEFFVDLSERKKAEDMLARLGRVLDDTANEIYIFDADSLRFVQVNQGAHRNLGYTMNELRTLTPIDLKPEFNAQTYADLIAPLRRGDAQTVVIETLHKRKNNSLYPVEVRLQLSHTETTPAFVAFVQDITERRQSQQELHRLAHHDALTGLPNRVMLHSRLQQTLSEAEKTERLVAVMFLDLDHFKSINDSLGHEVGDMLLKSVAGRLLASVRAGDTIARLGGDEFAVVLANVAHVDDVTSVAQKIIGQFLAPFRIGGHELFISASIGITLFPLDDGDTTRLLRNADIAMYRAKELGRNRHQFFTPELNIESMRRLELEIGLRQAIEKREFVLFYQPLVDLVTGKICGMEALLRWQHPKFGLINPLDFVPLAEETGLIIPIGEWVLTEACAQTKTWHELGFPELQVAINISSKQLRDKNLIDVVKHAFQTAGLEPQHLDLEITESVLMQDMTLAASILQELNAVGVSFSLDDFGTGYSSLSYLKRFPVDYLKIDRSFVHDVTVDSFGAGLVQAIIAMSKVLNIKVIAEGVENQKQIDLLISFGCDIVQGFHYSGPLTVDEFTNFLHQWRSPIKLT